MVVEQVRDLEQVREVRTAAGSRASQGVAGRTPQGAAGTDGHRSLGEGPPAGDVEHPGREPDEGPHQGGRGPEPGSTAQQADLRQHAGGTRSGHNSRTDAGNEPGGEQSVEPRILGGTVNGTVGEVGKDGEIGPKTNLIGSKCCVGKACWKATDIRDGSAVIVGEFRLLAGHRRRRRCRLGAAVPRGDLPTVASDHRQDAQKACAGPGRDGHGRLMSLTKRVAGMILVACGVINNALTQPLVELLKTTTGSTFFFLWNSAAHRHR